MVIIAAVSALTYAQMDGQAAYERTARFVSSVTGVTSLELDTLTPMRELRDIPRGEQSPRWAVGLRDGQDRMYSVTMTAGGAILTYNGPNLSAKLLTRPQISDDRLNQWVARALKAMPPVRAYAVENRGYGPDNVLAYAAATVNGRRIFTPNPMYGYVIRFDLTGRMVWFARIDQVPAVQSAPVRVTPGAAWQKLANYAKTAPNTDGTARLLMRDWPQPTRLEVEVGYYHGNQDPRLRLGYQGVVWSRAGSDWRRSGTLDTVVDAETGRLMPREERG